MQLDALVHSGTDKGEQLEEALDPAPKLVVSTLGARGRALGRRPRGAPAPGRRRSSRARGVNAYGAGDSFAAGLTYGLGAPAMDRRGGGAARGALRRAKLTGRGATDNQLTLARR